MSEDSPDKLQEDFSLVHVIEIITLSVFITAGALIISGWLIGNLGDSPATDIVQLVTVSLGGFMVSMGYGIRWLLSRWG
jgi:hypothetical protein